MLLLLACKQAGAGTAASPLVLEAEDRAREAVDDPHASEEKELQEKVDNEARDIPNLCIAACINTAVVLL